MLLPLQVLLSEDFVHALSFILYKSDCPLVRRRMTVPAFAQQCKLPTLDAPRVKKCVTTVMVVLKRLAGELPFLDPGVLRWAKADQVLSYVGDVIKYKDMLVHDVSTSGDTSSEETSLNSTSKITSTLSASTQQMNSSVGPDEMKSTKDDEDLNDLDDDELGQYIRSEGQVKALKPLYEKHFAECDEFRKRKRAKKA